MKKIFVFGSNLAGIHGGGAARYSHQKLGAEWGVGEGPTGDTYALPTKDQNIETRTLDEVRQSVDRFLRFSVLHSDLEFQVTRVGCGLAGFTDEQIAPLFLHAASNCTFDSAWEPWLPCRRYWGTF